MKISRTFRESDVIDSIVTKQTITIEIEPGDDPQGYINGLVIRGRLASFLQGFGAPSGFARPDMSEGDFWNLLTTYGYVADGTESAYDLLLTIARDQRGLSWRAIESATGISQATIRRRVKAARHRFAESGRWINAAGIQWSDPENAEMHADILDFSDDRESAICRYCHERFYAAPLHDPLKHHVEYCTRNPTSDAYIHRIEIDYGTAGEVQTLYAELDYATYEQVVAAQSHESPENAYVSVYARLAPTPDSELAPRVLRGSMILRVEPIREPRTQD